jgi:hypothetical protein
MPKIEVRQQPNKCFHLYVDDKRVYAPTMYGGSKSAVGRYLKKHYGVDLRNDKRI